jgi:DHA2 family methylenomycin A resistance protein-like MFS transporter
MLPPSLFRERNFSAISYMFFAGTLAFFGMLFVLSFYFQQQSGLSALQTGFALFPLSCCVVLGNKLAGRLAARFTPRSLMLVGESAKLVGFAGLLLTRVDSHYAVSVVPLCAIGLGGGLAAPMYTSLFMSGVRSEYTGIASGFSRASGQVGSAVGVAAFGALIADELSFLRGMTVAISIAMVLTLSILVLIHRVVRDNPSLVLLRQEEMARAVRPRDGVQVSRS